MSQLLAFLCLFLVSLRAEEAETAAVEGDEAVFTLTSDNFDEFISSHERVLVEFYAPWCGHCKALAPEYEKAAQQINNDENIDAQLAKVDATIHKDLATKYGVRGFPTLKYFTKDLDNPSDYSGGRTQDTIVSWVSSRSLPPVSIINTIDEFNNFKSKSRVVLIGLFEEGSDKSNALTAVAEANRETVVVGLVSDKSLSLPDGITFDKLYLFRDFDTPVLEFDGDASDSDAITEFINSERFPIIDEIGPENYKDYMDRGLPLVWISVNPEESEAKDNVLNTLSTVGQRYKGQLSFVWVDSVKYAQHVQNLGITDTPGLLIVGTLKYLFDGGDLTNIDDVNAWFTKYDKGELNAHLKSEEIPETNDEPVYVLVGKSFNDIVYDDSKDVFVEFYAPWCGHCKRLAPEYEKVGEAFKDISDVIIAKIDATENDTPEDIRGFPTLLFYPQGHSKDEPAVKYNGERKSNDIIDWIKSNAKADLTDMPKTDL